MSLLTSLLFGWWGLPWGLIGTPIQVVRNLWGILIPRTHGPSADLAEFARVMLASSVADTNSPDCQVEMPVTRRQIELQATVTVCHQDQQFKIQLPAGLKDGIVIRLAGVLPNGRDLLVRACVD